MKIILLLFLCVSFVYCRQSQTTQKSQLSQESDNIIHSRQPQEWVDPAIILSDEIRINLYNDNKYSLKGTIYGNAMATRVLISQGEFSIMRDTLILKDKFNDYVQKFLLRNNHAIGIKTFKPFMNGLLSIQRFNEDLDVSWINIQERRKENELSKTGMEKIRYGSYGGEEMSLSLREPNRYVFVIFHNIVSKGTFKQNNNEIILFDDANDYVFYFFLTKDGVIENITPISEILPFN